MEHNWDMFRSDHSCVSTLQGVLRHMERERPVSQWSSQQMAHSGSVASWHLCYWVSDICLPICLPLCVFAYLPDCLSVSVSVYLSVFDTVWVSVSVSVSVSLSVSLSLSLCGNSLVSNFTHSFMPICIQMLPVILYLLISSFARTSC